MSGSLTSAILPSNNIRGSLYDTQGNVVGETNPVLIDELPAKAHVWRNRNQLSDLIGDTWNGTASLKIDNADVTSDYSTSTSSTVRPSSTSPVMRRGSEIKLLSIQGV